MLEFLKIHASIEWEILAVPRRGRDSDEMQLTVELPPGDVFY